MNNPMTTNEYTVYNLMLSGMVAAAVCLSRDEPGDAYQWLTNSLQGLDPEFWPKPDEDLDIWAQQFQQGNKINHIASVLGSTAITNLLYSITGAFESGCVDSNTLTVSDLYQTVRRHLADNFGKQIPNIVDAFDEEFAKLAGLHSAPPHNATRWMTPHTPPKVPEGTEESFWIAVKKTGKKDPQVFQAHYVNKPLKMDDENDVVPGDYLVNFDGEELDSVGWFTAYAHNDFDLYFEPISFNEDCQLLGWAAYVPPAFHIPSEPHSDGSA